jgi:hypothetical protein
LPREAIVPEALDRPVDEMIALVLDAIDGAQPEA